MKTNKTSANRKHRGIGFIWLIISFMTFLVFAALVIDTSRVYVTGHQLQNAADAAALAGSRYVAWDPNSATKITAREQAYTVAQANQASNLAVNLYLNTSNAANGDIVIGLFNPDEPDPALRWTPMDPADFAKRSPNAMKVVTRKNDDQNPRLPLMFASIFGVNFSTIQKDATAMITNIKGAAVIALSKTEIGVYLHGTPEINIQNEGSIYANTVGTSADFRGNPGTDVAEINLVGDYTVSGGFSASEMTYADLPTVVNTGMPPIKDPYIGLDEPTINLPVSPTAPATGALKITGGTHVLEPGYYAGGFDFTGGNITLKPGIYQLGGGNNKGGLDISGNVTITGYEVMFHVVDGSVDIRGSKALDKKDPTNTFTGTITLTPPASGTYEGITIFQSRANDKDAEINGGGALNMTGVLYFPNNHLWVAGNGGSIGTQLIADTIEIAGTGAINIPYNGSPEVAQTSYLVE